uniref:Tcomplex protein 1 subunit zeta putative n=1 Tax=Albugo laibachii Nc14 TaxID=890382 RepID=F0W2E3_9STRA|nr:Tcomplex protein 1 subunit zeta putative [Albugo laibachii Nc14]|eukprot:CCA15229.1 Tcomplex protein 1 subunit zeta putative [Albugo laibachii Nc14]
MSFGRTNYRIGGTRGGADHFKWDDVKADKYRENYLGHSVCAPVGRWQRGKDLTWYAKNGNDESAGAAKAMIQAEISAAKQRDEDMMNEALGLAPRRRPSSTHTLDATEMKELLKRGDVEHDSLYVERVEGLGAASEAIDTEIGAMSKKTMAERYKDRLGKADDTYGLPGNITNPDEECDETKLETEVGTSLALGEKSKKRKKEKKRKREKKAKGKRKRKANSSDHESLAKDQAQKPHKRVTPSRSRTVSRSLDNHRQSPIQEKNTSITVTLALTG